jgi:hypothetical protein
LPGGGHFLVEVFREELVHHWGGSEAGERERWEGGGGEKERRDVTKRGVRRGID